MKEQEIYYYSDELNDEFSGSHITPRVIDEKYKYLHKNIFWNLAHFLVQNVLSVPIKVLYAKLKFRIKYIGKEKLKPYRKEGYFVYVNHTQVFADDQQSYSSVENLANYEQGIPPYAYCLPRYAKLDGTYENAPDEITQGGKGYISASLSDQNGAFETAPMITITFDRLKTSNGLLIV